MPAGNPAAAIGLLRLHSYTNHAGYRDKAEQTIELLASVAAQYGMFAATYGIAAVNFSEPHTQVVIIGDGEAANELYAAANSRFSFGKSAVRIKPAGSLAQNIPPALAQTIALLPGIEKVEAIAVVCSGSSCQPPTASPEELLRYLDSAR